MIADEILQGKDPSRPRHTMPTKPAIDNQVVHKVCDVCQVTCVRESEWISHTRGRRHHKMLASHKRQKLEAYQQLAHTLKVHENNLRSQLKNSKFSTDNNTSASVVAADDVDSDGENDFDGLLSAFHEASHVDTGLVSQTEKDNLADALVPSGS